MELLIVGVVCLVLGAAGGVLVARNNPKILEGIDWLAARVDVLGDLIEDMDSGEETIATKGTPSYGASFIDPGMLIGGKLTKADWERMLMLAGFRLPYWEADGRYPEFVIELKAWIAFCKSQIEASE